MFLKEKETVEMNTIFGDIILTYMKCPQVSAPVKVELKMNNNLTEHERNEMIKFADNFVNLKQKLNPRILDRFIDIVGFI